MNISFLETFYWVATLKNFSEAAKCMRVSQPVVSMRMASLQRELGANLYRGSGKTFELTNAGRRIFAKCQAIVALSKELEEEARDAASADTTGYIGVTDVVALSWLPALLSGLRSVPSLNVGLRVGNSTDQLAALQAGDIDVAVILAPVNDPNLISDTICEFTVRWVGSPALIDPSEARSIHDLLRLPIIRSPRNTYYNEKMLEYFRWHEVPEVETSQPRWLDVGLSIATCAYLASQGVGLSALPVAAVLSFVEEGRLSVYDIPEEFLPWQIGIVRKRNANNRIVDPVIDCARRAAAAFAPVGANTRYYRAVQS